MINAVIGVIREVAPSPAAAVRKLRHVLVKVINGELKTANMIVHILKHVQLIVS